MPIAHTLAPRIETHRIEATQQGRLLEYAEALELLTMPADEALTEQVLATGRALTWRAADGRGQLYAQIGIDAQPCLIDCHHCAFAVGNGEHTQPIKMDLDEIVAHARIFDAGGVHLISLMTTAAYSFDEYLEVMRAVRNAVRPEMPLLANCNDMNAEQARHLKAAGADAVYHAIRLGEGRMSRVQPETRRRTIANVRAAGLKLMTGIEPLTQNDDPREIADLMFETRDMRPVSTGCCPLVPLAGSRMADVNPPSDRRRRFIGSIYRLVVGISVPFGMGNISWIDSGASPRGRHLSANATEMTAKIAKARAELEQGGWQISNEPPTEWLAR
jgi:biotin synthase